MKEQITCGEFIAIGQKEVIYYCFKVLINLGLGPTYDATNIYKDKMQDHSF